MSLERAIKTWRREIGAENVVVAGDACEAAQTATFPVDARVRAIVRPGTVDEVSAVVRCARRERVAIYPISSGKNWGHGSSAPPRGVHVIVDLGRLTRIVALDEELGTVTVQAGVTFAQLHRRMTARKSKLVLNRVSVSSNVTLVGNALERGIGRGLYGDRASTACALQVVTGTGEVIRTGFGRFEHARAARLHAAGVGPSLDGLFFQSNLGIVTEMTFWLPRRSADVDAVAIPAVDLRRLGEVVDAVRPLFGAGVFRPMSRLVSGRRLVSSILAEGRTSEITGARPKGAYRVNGGYVAPWAIQSFVHYPDVALRTATREYIRRALEPIGAEPHFTAASENAALSDLVSGWTDYQDVASAYWAKDTLAPSSPNPDRDRCGIISIRPIVPFRGRDLQRAIRIMEASYRKYRLDPMIGFSIGNDRTVNSASFIFYDRDETGADDRAMACAKDMNRRLIAAGYYPYRLGLESSDALPDPGDEYNRVRRAIKRVFDPAGILAPGRYE